jgi:phosphate acetyltransferase
LADTTATTYEASKYDRLITAAQEVPSAVTIVVHPCDETSLRGALEAAEHRLIIPVLIGPESKIRQVAADNRLD